MVDEVELLELEELLLEVLELDEPAGLPLTETFEELSEFEEVLEPEEPDKLLIAESCVWYFE